MKIVACARTYLGTPFHHQGRLRGIGVDCAGVPILVAKELGLSDFDTADYGRSPNGDMMRRTLIQHMDSIPITEAGPGDVLLMAWDADPQHVAIVTDNGGIIHAHARVGKVVEHQLDNRWSTRVRAAFRFRVRD